MPRSAVLKLVVASVAPLVALVAWIGPAHAAFPGRNGRIAYVRPDGGGASRIFTADPDGANEQVLAVGRNPAWSPNGFRLAFDDGKDVWVVDADGTGLHNLTQNDGGLVSVQPAWNWNGSQLAFSQRLSATQQADIFTMPVAGGQRTRVTTNSADDTHPAWSPTSSAADLIVFESNRIGNGELFAIFTDGTSERQVSHGAGGHSPDWNPNGAQLVFRDDAFHVEVVDATGANQRPLTSGGAMDDDPVFSPDGTSIAFQRLQNNAMSIWRAASDGSNPAQIITPTSAAPNWAIVPAPRSGADLAVTVDVTGTAGESENNVQYTATVSNDGPQPADPPVTLQFTLSAPYDTATTSSSDGSWQCAPDQAQPRQIDCTRQVALAAGATSTVTFALPQNQGGCPGQVHATVSSATPDPDQTNNSANQAGSRGCVLATSVTNETDPNAFSPPSGGVPPSATSSTSSPPQPAPVLPIANSNPRVLGSTISAPAGPAAAPTDPGTSAAATPAASSSPAPAPSAAPANLAHSGANVDAEVVIGALFFAVGMGALALAEIFGLVRFRPAAR